MGSRPKQDYLGTECDLGGLSIPDFQAAFCSHCTQPECSRSLDGMSKFDQRVRTWHERLFLNPPRMDQSDPRYKGLASKKFLTMASPIEIRSTGGGSAWIDPQTTEEPEQKSTPTATNIPETPEAPAPAPTPPQKRFLPMNTPNQGGVLLKGAPAPAPQKDPWAGKPAPGPKENVVAPGTKIRLGGGGPGVK